MALVLLMALGPAGAVRAETTVVVGVYQYEPLMGVGGRTRSDGFLIDIMQAIANRNGWRLVFRTGSWPDCQEWLERGEIDVLGGVAFTEENAARFVFGRESLLVARGQIYARFGLAIESVADLADKKIAVVQGDPHYQDFQVVIERSGLQCRFVEAEDYETVLLMVAAGRCDAGIVSQFFGGYHRDRFAVIGSPVVSSPRQLFFATRRDHRPGLIAALDDQLWQLKRDKRSAYHLARLRWLNLQPEHHLPTWIWWVCLGGGAVALGLLLHAMAMRRVIRTKTRELSKKNQTLSEEILQRRQAETKLHRQNEYLGVLHATALGLMDRLDLEELLQALVKRAGALLSASAGFIYLYDKELKALVLKAGSGGFAAAIGDQVMPGQGLVGQVYQTGQAIGVDDYLAWPRLSEKPLTDDVRGVLAVPLRSGGGIKGVIGFAQCHTPTQFHTAEQRILEQFAELAAIAIDNAHLYTRLQRELAERRRMEDQLLQAQKMEAIGTLAGGIAHDFNNILGAIIGFTEISLYDLPQNASARSNMEQVLQAGNRARDLVKQILAFSRKSNTDHELIDLVPITKEVLKLLRASLPSTIEIQSRIGPDISMIMADPIQIHQVLMNLCTNAAHAMEDGGGRLDVELGQVALSVEDHHACSDVEPGRYVQLIIRDNGHGIEPGILDRIFDPYFTTKEMDKGTGMGLAVVHGIVTSQKGCIRVKSQLTCGTEFEVLFPAVENQERRMRPRDLPIVRGTERVLFVDDEVALAQLGKTMLERLGYEVRACTSSLEALEIFRVDPDRWDLLVTDLTMPRMTGVRLAQKLRELRPSLPVIICTGYSEEMAPDHIRSLGINGLLLKPLVLGALSQEVRRALDEVRAFFN